MKNKTKTTIKLASLLLLVAISFSVFSANAAEVTGVLSSSVQNSVTGSIGGTVGSGGSQVTGSFGSGNVGNNNTIGGTVTGGVNPGGSGGGGGGGGGSGGGGGGVFSPSVLGASTSQPGNNNANPMVLGASTTSLPNTGFPTQEQNIPWNILISFALLMLVANLFIATLRKHAD